MSACTFFGHRDCPKEIQDAVACAIESLILNNGVKTFYVGNQGNFDRVVLCALQRMKQKYAHIDCAVVLAYLQYEKEKMDVQADTIYPSGIETIPKRFCIAWRNRWMIHNADYVIVYVTRSVGGAAQFADLARKKGKRIWNIADGRGLTGGVK